VIGGKERYAKLSVNDKLYAEYVTICAISPAKQEVIMAKQPTLAVTPQSTATLSNRLNPFVPQATLNVGVIERLASLLVGATVVLLIVRRFLLYGGLTVVGGYLLYRGMTGYCPLYASEQIDTRHWRMKLSMIPGLRETLVPSQMETLWRQCFPGNEKRSKYHEQNNRPRQVATRAWQPEDGVGPVDG
jgi:hypothetical protein